MFEIDIYLDVKSPHSYLMMKPALHLEKDYSCKVNFKPYDLSYVDINVTTDHDPENPVRKPKDKTQDRRARMYYTVARVYAKAMGLKLRGPEILLSAEKANMGIAWALKYRKSANYLTEIYSAGWPNGWRDYDMTNIDNLKATLMSSGLKPEQVEGFQEYVENDGPRDLQRFKKEAEETGAVGVPHLAFDYKDRKVGMFGREHLGLIRHTMHQLGLARSSKVNWEVSHYWFAE